MKVSWARTQMRAPFAAALGATARPAPTTGLRNRKSTAVIRSLAGTRAERHRERSVLTHIIRRVSLSHVVVNLEVPMGGRALGALQLLAGGMTSMTVDDGRYVGISEVAESTGFRPGHRALYEREGLFPQVQRGTRAGAGPLQPA